MTKAVLIGTEGRRFDSFKTALSKFGIKDSVVVSYLDLLSGCDLRRVIGEGDLVRIESPGKDFEVERALLRLGAEGVRGRQSSKERLVSSGAESHGERLVSSEGERQPSKRVVSELPPLSVGEVDALQFDKGLILPQAQWYYSWCQLMETIESQLDQCPPHLLMNDPVSIKTMFNKIECLRLFRSAGLATPGYLGGINGFDSLSELMDENNCRRVFVKPAHSSSASGIVAYQRSGNKHLATTTVETVYENGFAKLYNSRRVRRIESIDEIRRLIDNLSVNNLYVEKWFPKAGLNGKTFDLRVLVVGGQSRHVVVRTSRTPFTNLHLLNGRGQLSAVKKLLGEEHFNAILGSCETAAKLFPSCIHAGVDVLVGADLKTHAVPEVNAFGDLLPGIVFDGMDTYECELNAMGFISGKSERLVEILSERSAGGGDA